MKQQNLLPGISLPAHRPSRPAETPPAPSPAASAVPDTDTWSPQESLLHSAFVFEPAGTAAEPVLILGLDCAQPLREGLAPARLRLIEQADVLCGGRRLLAAFDDLPARQLPLTAPLEPVLARISHLRAGGFKGVVLADGSWAPKPCASCPGSAPCSRPAPVWACPGMTSSAFPCTAATI